MSTRKKQSKFVRMVALLINEATDRGYEFTFGDALAKDLNPLFKFLQSIKKHLPGDRVDEYNDVMALLKSALHKKLSNHYGKLAIDLNLFKDGKWMTETEDHKELGEYWESLGGAWGGGFKDGNHYSLEHNGRK